MVKKKNTIPIKDINKLASKPVLVFQPKLV